MIIITNEERQKKNLECLSVPSDKHSMSVIELGIFFRTLPVLGAEESQIFEQDLKMIRGCFKN